MNKNKMMMKKIQQQHHYQLLNNAINKIAASWIALETLTNSH